VVIPALGCGVAGFSLREGARLICEEIDTFHPENLEDVLFIAYRDEEFETVQEAAAAFDTARV
jgi:O-acetyl-ADP-ribose deacetylase (regulator of RNase III)